MQYIAITAKNPSPLLPWPLSLPPCGQRWLKLDQCQAVHGRPPFRVLQWGGWIDEHFSGCWPVGAESSTSLRGAVRTRVNNYLTTKYYSLWSSIPTANDLSQSFANGSPMITSVCRRVPSWKLTHVPRGYQNGNPTAICREVLTGVWLKTWTCPFHGRGNPRALPASSWQLLGPWMETEI